MTKVGRFAARLRVMQLDCALRPDGVDEVDAVCSCGRLHTWGLLRVGRSWDLHWWCPACDVG